jgi:hypothetical protein
MFAEVRSKNLHAMQSANLCPIYIIKAEFNQLTKASEKVPFSIREGDRNEIRNH